MLAPRRSLHRLRTVFTSSTSSETSSSTLSPRSSIMTPSTATSNCLTPLALSTSWDSPSQIPWTPDTWTSPSIPASKAHRAIRKKKSTVEIRQQEERQQVREELLGLIEPRPGAGVARGGIEEVLHGEA